MQFYLRLATAREAREAHHNLNLMALAAQGSAKAIKDQLRALWKEFR